VYAIKTVILRYVEMEREHGFNCLICEKEDVYESNRAEHGYVDGASAKRKADR
jgi:hypothetical protein